MKIIMRRFASFYANDDRLSKQQLIFESDKAIFKIDDLWFHFTVTSFQDACCHLIIGISNGENIISSNHLDDFSFLSSSNEILVFVFVSVEIDNYDIRNHKNSWRFWIWKRIIDPNWAIINKINIRSLSTHFFRLFENSNKLINTRLLNGQAAHDINIVWWNKTSIMFDENGIFNSVFSVNKAIKKQVPINKNNNW